MVLYEVNDDHEYIQTLEEVMTVMLDDEDEVEMVEETEDVECLVEGIDEPTEHIRLAVLLSMDQEDEVDTDIVEVKLVFIVDEMGVNE